LKSPRRSRRNDGCSFLDDSVTVEGELRFEGTLRIAGNLVGSVTTSGELIVEREARLEASIQAGELSVYGRVIEEVTCRHRAEIRDGGVLIGDVQSPQFLIEEGGRFEGTSLRPCPETRSIQEGEQDDEPGRSTLEVSSS
jgi:cytoskeletal protein CcmA (bactofilin family)